MSQSLAQAAVSPSTCDCPGAAGAEVLLGLEMEVSVGPA